MKHTKREDNTFLTSASPLTNLFKIFYELFGHDFFDNTLIKMLAKIDEDPPLNLTSTDPADLKRISELVNFCITIFISSAHLIGPEMRHMAYLLKSYTEIWFRELRASYSALCHFYCLRFVVASLTDPQLFNDKQIVIKNLQKNIIPFVQLLQRPFNLQVIDQKYPNLTQLSDQMIDRYEDVVNFVFSLAEPQYAPNYPIYTEAEVNESLEFVIQHISNDPIEFSKAYDEMYQADSNLSGASFSLIQLMNTYFE